MKKFLGVLLAFSMAVIFSSCFIRPYDKPEYVEVGTNETAFVIPLFTDDNLKTEDQVQVNSGSEEYYKKKMVSSKLINVPHVWKKTGRFRSSGEWIDAVKVVKVSLTPISGKWMPDTKSSIKVETAASQGVQIPITYDIRVTAENAAKFLSYYPQGSLEEVINNQINRYFAGIVGREFHKIEYKDVNLKRDEIIDLAVEDTKSHFANEGITITALAVYDGLIFDDNSLQESIDAQAKAQADALLEKQQLEKKKQALENEIAMEKLKKEKLAAERENAEYEANTKVRVTQIQQSTYKIEVDKKRMEQEVANLKLKGEAEAEAIKIRAGRWDGQEVSNYIPMTANGTMVELPSSTSR